MEEVQIVEYILNPPSKCQISYELITHFVLCLLIKEVKIYFQYLLWSFINRLWGVKKILPMTDIPNLKTNKMVYFHFSKSLWTKRNIRH